MNYTEKTKPGMGDPYWYEWSVGEQQIINMLNEDNNIEYVELQANVGLGLDDVVVTYSDGRVLCIQVKHTRANDTLTFADLVYSAKKTSKSLLAELADSWQEESRKYTEVVPQVFTNRRKGQVSSSTKGEEKFVRPALDVFWKKLSEKIKFAKNFEDIIFEEYPEAWNEWKTQLSGIQSNDDKLKFLRLLQLETEQKDLQEIENEVLSHLSIAFRITLDDADKLLGKLDHALRKWTTSVRNTSRIYVEDVYEALSIDDYISPYNHELIPAEPFFDSRKDFVEEIEKELLFGNEKVLFLSGIPGTGKTNIVSKLCNKRDSIIKIRYYAYEPIQPDKEYLPMDVSERVKKEHFWNEMFSQLKQCLKGSLHKYNVPLQNCFMSLEEMKKRFFEIASAYARDTGCTFVVAIDGIDHAARAGIVSETFLVTLPRPEYIPDNVKLLISGQPQESYPNYPLWLKRKDDNVKRLDVPGIERGDILSLVTQKISDTRRSEYNAITDIVEKYSEKNTLAAIFAVYEASQCADAMELERKLSDRKLSGNIEEYYSNIWNDAVGTLKQYDFVDYKLAGVFAFLNERVDGQMLAEIFNELDIPVVAWNNVLKTLKPLIVEESGKYHVLHNDVKVFLSNIVNIDDEHTREIGNSLTDYYLYKEDKSQAYWDEFHYRAKEWMLMVYELLTETKVMDKVLLESLVTKHINDSDFNAAFYSRILLQRLCGKNSFDMLKEKQKYFADIPEYSTKKLLSVKSTEQYLTGTRYVMESLKRITEEMWDDCSDIESKVAAYMNQISDTDHMLLDVGGRKQCGVALYDINVAFLRVLYKEWYQGRWDGAEIPLSRIILSTSEPYVLLQSPAILPYQESKILNVKIDEFEEQDEDDKEEMLKNIFTMGISDDEIVLGGALTEYSYKKELLGFMTTYIDFPMMKRDFALYVCERNARLLIHRSEEFVEEKHCNLLVHNVGVESFKGSNIMCMFSKCALNYFGWEIVFDDGLKIVDSNNKMIGRFEYYYGLRTEIGNSVYMNQPVIQRWVVTNEAFTEIQNMLVYDLNQVADAKVFEF